MRTDRTVTPRGRGARPARAQPQSASCARRARRPGALSADRQAGGEGPGAVDHLHAGERRVGVEVAELLLQAADAVAEGERRDGDGAQHPEGAALGVEERAAGVTRDARGHRVDVRGPAAGAGADAHTSLRAELADSESQRRVAVAVDVAAAGDSGTN